MFDIEKRERERDVLVVNDSFRVTTVRVLANLLKLCAFKDLSDVCVSLKLITFLLSRSQVTAHKAKACLVQGHAYGYTSLHLLSTIPNKVTFSYVHKQKKLLS